MFNRMNPQDDENNKYNNLMNKNNNKNMNMKISTSTSLASFEDNQYDDTKNTQEQLNTLQKLIQAKHTLTKSPNRAKNYKQLA